MIPSCVPTSSPSDKRTSFPSRKPSSTKNPSKKPVIRPTRRPTRRPSLPPSEFPTSVPTGIPIDDDYWTVWLPTSQLTNAPSNPSSSGLHGNGQIDSLPTSSPTIKPSGSIRAIQVDINGLRLSKYSHNLFFISLFPLLILISSLEHQRCHSGTDNDRLFS